MNLKTGGTLAGILWEVRGELLTLKDASYIQGTSTVTVDGEAVVERSNIDWLQVIGV